MSPPFKLTPLPTLLVSPHTIPTHALIPNNTHLPTHPLLIYHSAYPPTTPASTLEAHLLTNNFTPQWRYTMYKTTHYHSTTHEFLCITSGRATLLFGGEQNPGKVEVTVGAGDTILVPAGVGHRLVEDIEGGFEMVGSYPKGCEWDICYGVAGEEEKVEAVKRVKRLERDPLYGEGGPAMWGEEEWRGYREGRGEV